jgi:spermidine synthase
LFGGFLANSNELRDYVGMGALNTDDQPRVMYRAPRAGAQGLRSPLTRLMDLMKSLHAEPSDILQVQGAEARSMSERLSRYWRARDAYMALGARLSPEAPPSRLVLDAAEPLLRLVRLSRDFGPASSTLKGIAQRVARVQPDVAARLLSRLRDDDPNAPELAEPSARLEQKSSPAAGSRRGP